MEAVQTYDIYSKDFEKNVLREILFVDILSNMVDVIQERFSLDWYKEARLKQITEDLDFLREKKKIPGQRINSNTFSSQEDTDKKSKSAVSKFRSNNLAPTHSSGPSDHSKTSQPSTERSSLSKQTTYNVGRHMLRTSAVSALEQDADLLVVVGDFFQRLHFSPVFDVKKHLSINMNIPQQKNRFIVYGMGKSFPLIFQLLIAGYDKENFNQAFETLREVTTSFNSQLGQVKSVVFTTSALYSSKSGNF